MKLAQELNVEKHSDTANVQLYIPENLFWFQGHFPEQPLLPGVTQLTWVMHYCQTLLGIKPNLASIDVIKFQRPILPNSTVNLALIWQPASHKLQFQYSIINNTEHAIASSGKIGLCQQ